jgi:hypothetical protein
MALDRTKLQNVTPRANGSFTARCPACAGTGGDTAGNHLIVYEDGRFACVVYPGSSGKEHRGEIAKLVATDTPHRPPPPKAITIRRVVVEPPRTLMVLGHLGRQETHSQGDNAAIGTGDHKSPAPPETSHKDEVTRPRRPETEEEVEEHSEFLHE